MGMGPAPLVGAGAASTSGEPGPYLRWAPVVELLKRNDTVVCVDVDLLESSHVLFHIKCNSVAIWLEGKWVYKRRLSLLPCTPLSSIMATLPRCPPCITCNLFDWCVKKVFLVEVDGVESQRSRQPSSTV